jgi:hypothetical protein
VFEDLLNPTRRSGEVRAFFEPAAMDEYRDDPKRFKQGLARDVPVIANTLRQRQPN